MVLGDTAGLKFRYSHMIGDGQTHFIVGVYINATHYQDCQELNPWKVEFVGEFYHNDFFDRKLFGAPFGSKSEVEMKMADVLRDFNVPDVSSNNNFAEWES